MVVQMSNRSYSELIRLNTFEERYRYLRLGGVIGKETFGFDRYLNQSFYRSPEYLKFRRDIIVRDMGCDLGIADRVITGPVIVHHINPITIDDVQNRRIEILINPNNVICVSASTHNAIHYGDESMLIIVPIERRKNDTCPWKKDRREE